MDKDVSDLLTVAFIVFVGIPIAVAIALYSLVAVGVI